uniref:MFS domain-containing protein n=1 Tax=Rhabditophanes sp. KR3021 TaxID=114890 RepID=A0AC35U1U3_9BILA
MPTKAILQTHVAQTTNWVSIYLVGLIAFLGILQNGVLRHLEWPYLQQMDSQSSPTFYGIMGSVQSIAHMVSTALGGFIINKWCTIKLPVVIGKIISLGGSILFVLIEVIPDNRRYAFMGYAVLAGLAMGFVMMMRIHVIMVSTEKDRSKAFAIIAMAPMLGIIAGNFSQTLITKLGYPGSDFWLFGNSMHLNLYTVPAYFAIFNIALALALLFMYFNEDDGMKKFSKKRIIAARNEQKSNLQIGANEKDLGNSEQDIVIGKIDKVAMLVCFLLKMGMSCTMSLLQTLFQPYTQTIFRFTNEELVYYGSITSTLTGILGLSVNLSYLFLNLGKYISERKAIALAMTIILVFFLATFPYPFITTQIQYVKSYEFIKGSDSELNNNTTELIVGCENEFKWCEVTPAVSPFVWFPLVVICFGTALPLMLINLEVVYSKILGPIKQGTYQSVFMIIGWFNFFSLIGYKIF